VPDAAALVAGLSARVRAVLHDVAHLVAVVAGVLVLATVPRDVARAVALVAAVLLLPALTGKVPEPVALVALGAAASLHSRAKCPNLLHL